MRGWIRQTLAAYLTTFLAAGCSDGSNAGSSSGGSSSAGSSSAGSSSAGSSSGGSGNGSSSGGSSGTATDDAGSGGAGGGGGGTIYPPGPPGCGLAQAAFCETFDAPAGAATRAGELDPKRWSAARMCNIGGPSGDGEAVAIGTAKVPACRGDLPAQVLPASDALICDGNPQVQSNHLLVLVAAQNYGQNSYRIRQPFDFDGRTGKIVFDAEGRNIALQGWISLEVTEDPTPAPSFTLQENWENGAIPRNAIEIQFSHNCGGDQLGIGEFLVYDDFSQTSLASNEGDCVAAEAGRLNRFEVEIAQNRVAVYATPASEDGLSFAERVLLAAFDVDLPFTRGYVHLTTHNHASLKYSNDEVDAWAARWDNVGFDGPAMTGGWREYEALDSLSSANGGKVNVGWRLADQATGPAQEIAIAGVDPSGVSRARLALENWSQHFAGSAAPTDFALNYRLNGRAWKVRTLTPSELAMMTALPNAGTRSLMLDVDVADLVAGANTLELTTTNAPMSYPPVALNVDLILETP
jgi:hypothetical protein